MHNLSYNLTGRFCTKKFSPRRISCSVKEKNRCFFSIKFFPTVFLSSLWVFHTSTWLTNDVVCIHVSKPVVHYRDMLRCQRGWRDRLHQRHRSVDRGYTSVILFGCPVAGPVCVSQISGWRTQRFKNQYWFLNLWSLLSDPPSCCLIHHFLPVKIHCFRPPHTALPLTWS